MNLRIAILATLLGVFSSGAAIAGPQPGDIRITDPVELAQLGFDPATDEVWRAPYFDDRQLRQERLALTASPQGLPATEWTSVQASAFNFMGQGAIYNQVSNLSLTCLPGSSAVLAEAPIELPNDRQVTWLDVWAVDSSATEQLYVSLYEMCVNLNDPSQRSFVPLASVTTGTSFSAGKVWLTAHAGPDRWVRSTTCSHVVFAQWSSCSAGAAVRLQKVRVWWN